MRKKFAKEGEISTYPSSFTDAEWAVVESALAVILSVFGRTPEMSNRQFLNAIAYRNRTGCSWRELPREFGPWENVYQRFRQWKRKKIWDKLLNRLRELERESVGKNKEPTGAIIDSQSVKMAWTRIDEKGYDGYKKVKGRKRHIVTDTRGNILEVKIHAANIHDSVGGKELLKSVHKQYPTIKKVWADQGYEGLQSWAKAELGIELEITSKPGKGFQVVPKRWVVERTNAWMDHFRLLSREYDTSVSSSKANVKIAISIIIARRLAKSSDNLDFKY